MTYKEIAKVYFPMPTRLNVNMMPIIQGDIASLPVELRPWQPIIDLCQFEKGSTTYLTIHESYVEAGTTQRRPGIHTDGTDTAGWGDGGWGGLQDNKGIYMASTDGLCAVWNEITYDVDHLGSLLKAPIGSPYLMRPKYLYWMTDRTPHASLVASKAGGRQFFRLVSENIGVWYSKHNTVNPLGIQPKALIDDRNKFEGVNCD